MSNSNYPFVTGACGSTQGERQRSELRPQLNRLEEQLSIVEATLAGLRTDLLDVLIPDGSENRPIAGEAKVSYATNCGSELARRVEAAVERVAEIDSTIADLMKRLAL